MLLKEAYQGKTNMGLPRGGITREALSLAPGLKGEVGICWPEFCQLFSKKGATALLSTMAQRVLTAVLTKPLRHLKRAPAGGKAY